MSSKTILIATPPLSGHTNQLITLCYELCSRGHKIYFATSSDFKSAVEASGAIHIRWQLEETNVGRENLEKFNGIWDIVAKEKDPIVGEKLMSDVWALLYSGMHRAFEPIFKEVNPALVIGERAALPALDMAYLNKIPYVIYSPKLGTLAPNPPSLPDFGTPYSVHMSLREKILNRLNLPRCMILFRHSSKVLDRQRKDCGSNWGLNVLGANGTIIVSSTFGIEIPRALPPNVNLVGPIIRFPLPEISSDLQSWLNESPELPVVLAAFGTLAPLTHEQICKLQDGFVNVKGRVLWALRAEHAQHLKENSRNLKIVRSVPQTSILEHKKVRAFVSHCGANSVNESFYFGKPLLCLPINGDQFYNAARVVDNEAGIKLDINNFSIEQLSNAIDRLLYEPNFTAAAQRLSIVNQKQNGITRARDLIETLLEGNIRSITSIPIR